MSVVFQDSDTGFVPRQVAINAVHFRARGCIAHDVFDAECVDCQDGTACSTHRDPETPWTSWFDATCPHCVTCKDVVADYGTIAHHHIDESQLASEEELLSRSTIWRES